MKNTFGNHITLTLFGESHGNAVGAVLDGLPAGVKLDEALMEQMMKKRSARKGYSRNHQRNQKRLYLRNTGYLSDSQ